MKRSVFTLFIPAAMLLSLACARPPVPPQATQAPAATAQNAVFTVSAQTPAPTATLVPTASPTAVPEETPASATIGAVGDIAVDSRMLTLFSDAAGTAHSFAPAYQGMAPLFQGVDLMCGNLETPIAGEAVGYSGNAKLDADARQAKYASSFAFNAPDALAYDLKSVGFDFVSTANNHFSDRCFDGVLHTLDVLDAAGLLHAGTSRSEAERAKPCVVEVNGIRIGLLASNSVYNEMYDISVRRTPYLICNLNDRARIEIDVRICREAGAEFILMFTHWDEEYADAPSRATRRTAEWLLSVGVDAIIGSHPHVVQPIEYVTASRDGAPYTGLVVYSLGNSLLRMSASARYAQIYVQLTLERGADGAVFLKEAQYLPVFSVLYEENGVEYYEVLPACADIDRIPARVPGNQKVGALAAEARAHVLRVCGTGAANLMEDICWKS